MRWTLFVLFCSVFFSLSPLILPAALWPCGRLSL
jgi:hypothetical protein